MKKIKEVTIPPRCRHMVTMLIEQGYAITGPQNVDGAICMRRKKDRNPLICVKLSDPFAGVTFIPRTKETQK